MGTISTIAIIKLAVKLGIGIGTVVGISGVLNWLHNKKITFNKKGGVKHHDLETPSEISVR